MAQYELNSPEVIFDQFDDEAVIVNLKSGHYFSIPGNSAVIFQLLTSGVSTESIAQAYLPHETINRGKMKEELDAHLATLVHYKILRKAEKAITYEKEIPAIKFEKLIFEVFHDMEEVIMIDPVHEVDPEEGWPKQKN